MNNPFVFAIPGNPCTQRRATSCEPGPTNIAVRLAHRPEAAGEKRGAGPGHGQVHGE